MLGRVRAAAVDRGQAAPVVHGEALHGQSSLRSKCMHLLAAVSPQHPRSEAVYSTQGRIASVGG